jgi:WD40 repeat protein
MPDFVPARIFISYSTEDGSGAAAKLRKDLEAEHFSVWQDIVALEGGRDWWSQIEDALRSKALQHVVLIVTPGSLASPVVRREIRLAKQEGKTVSPVRGPGLDLAFVPRWLGQVCDLDKPEHWATLLNVLRLPGAQKRVPMMAPEPPTDFVQRSLEFGALKDKLLDAKGDAVAITAALRGAGGYGKTTLAKKLAHDDDIIEAYLDGVLWVELGEAPGNLLSIVSDLVETLTAERPALESLNAAASKLGEALGDRRILLVIDDAWREQDLRPFLQSGKNTTRLITTRRDDILPIEAERQPVDAMQATEALSLLERGLPVDQAAAQKPALEALATRLGEWAQLLKLVNGFLRDSVVKSRQPLAQAIAGVNLRLDKRGLIAFDARNEADRAKAIAKTIGVSLELLSEAERARFAELAVFPEDADTPIGIAARFWAKTGALAEIDTEDLLRQLESLSLLLSVDLERRSFRLHDTTRHFLRDQAGADGLIQLHKALLDSLDYSPDLSAESRRYFYQNYPHHLSGAGRRDQLDALLVNPGWLRAKFSELNNPQALFSDYDQYAATDFQRLVGRCIRLTTGICTRDPRQLMPQLIGRLLPFSEREECSRFLERAKLEVTPPALLTTRASLTPPGAETARLEGHTGTIHAFAMLPDGRLASGSTDATIRLWDLLTGTQLFRLKGHEGWVNALAVLTNGWLASGSSDQTVRLWDVNSAQEQACFQGHSGQINALAALPDGRLASSSDDATIRLWDATTGAEAGRLEGHEGRVIALACLPDGRLASGSSDKTVRLWELGSGREVARLEGLRGGVNALAMLPDGRLASGSNDRDISIRLWDIESGQESARLEGHREGVNAFAVLPDGRLASGSDGIRLWDVKSGQEMALLAGPKGVRALASLPGGLLASGSWDSTVRLWDAHTSNWDATLEGHRSGVWALTLLHSGRLASGADDATTRIWDIQTGAELSRLEGHGNGVWALASLPDGRLITGSADRTIRIWDPQNGAELARLEGHDGGVNSLVMLPDGRLASGSNDTTIRLWNIGTEAELCRLKGHTGRVWPVILLPDGRLASGSGDATIRLWDTESGAEMAMIGGHRSGVATLAVLPNGRLASGSSDTTIRLWDIQTRTELARLEGHNQRVNALVVLPGDRLLSGSDDKTVRLWNLKTGEEIARLEFDAAIFRIAELSDDRLVAGDQRGRLHWLEIRE